MVRLPLRVCVTIHCTLHAPLSSLVVYVSGLLTAYNEQTLVIKPDTLMYATCPSGIASLLADELINLGASTVQTAGAGVQFSGGLPVAYRACLWSRLANRILLPIHQGPAETPEALYSTVKSVDWSAHMSVDNTLAVDAFTAKSDITHSQYAALTVKDAIVDQFRDACQERPNVETQRPDLRVNAYVFRNKCRLAVDLSGEGLHRRGYRQAQGPAPLKENLAAAMLMQAGWLDAHKAGKPLVDPMCGSGTLLIEAALMARDIPPGQLRDYYGFLGWAGHDHALWQTCLQDAELRVQESASKTLPVIVGADRDAVAVGAAVANAKSAGVSNDIQWYRQSLGSSLQTLPAKQGLLISNPPYGVRVADDDGLYEKIGVQLSRDYAGWQCALLAASRNAVKRTRLPLKTVLAFQNGGIDCDVMAGTIPQARSHAVDTQGFKNRVVKNQKHLRKWLERNDVFAYRVYDAELPEFAMAIDVYDCDARYVVVQEYEAPSSVNVAMADQRRQAVIAVLPELLEVTPSRLFLKLRRQQEAGGQYNRQDDSRVLAVLDEPQGKLELNFSDYLDTGLFLDHRVLRRHLAENSHGKRVLNLFAYTASLSVAAAMGGATETCSVDLSKRYTEWACRNLELNGFVGDEHEVIRADVMDWLVHASEESGKKQYDWIVLDPPTFSNSRDLDHDWDVQRDHVQCILLCMSLLAPGGTLVFSNNFRRFKLDTTALQQQHPSINIADRTAWSLDRDFQRNTRIHRCWFLTQ